MRPICFVVMPYGRKPIGNAGTNAPANVDFDALWQKAYFPALLSLGYEPVRADQDVGALIVKEMIERLTLSDLVLADVSIPNGNVYYEIGVRHASRETGCVLVSADWARPLFDLDSMRRVRFPVPDGDVADATAQAIITILTKSIPALAKGRSPVHDSVPGYPSAPDSARATTFRERFKELAEFQGAVAAARATVGAERRKRCIDVRDRYAPPRGAVTAAVALEILLLLRDGADWQTMLDFAESLPEEIRDLPLVQEQRALGFSKLKNHQAAVALLEALIVKAGATSEREGLLGGRFKALFEEARANGDTRNARAYLDRAIEHYARGMRLDLNDYFPPCNLPRLLRIRGEAGDDALAVAAAQVTRVGCERALERDPSDQWIRPTLLGAAFDAGDVATARRLALEVRREGKTIWKLDTTLRDLQRSIDLQTDTAVKGALTEIAEELRQIV